MDRVVPSEQGLLLLVIVVTCLSLAAPWGAVSGGNADPPRTRGIEGPSARSAQAMAFDSESGRTVLFGGWDGASPFGDTWAYSFGSNPIFRSS